MERTRQIQQIKQILRQETDEGLLSFYLDLFKQKILNYCHRKDFPEELDLVLTDMVANFLNKQAAEVQREAQGGEISSITRGDTTISYGSKGAGEGQGSLSLDSFMTSYIPQLNAYRKVKAI